MKAVMRQARTMRKHPRRDARLLFIVDAVVVVLVSVLVVGRTSYLRFSVWMAMMMYE